MHQGKPLVVIEAKLLGTPLQNAANQASAYCTALKAQYLVCTDGDVWNVYKLNNSDLVPFKELRISSTDAWQVTQDMLFLWKPIICYSITKIPVVYPPDSPPPPPPPGIPLPELLEKLVAGQKVTLNYIHFPPQYSGTPIKSYKDLLVETVKYLDGQGLLPAGGIRTILIPSGSPLKNPARYSKVNSWFVCTHGSARQMIDYAIRVLNKCGLKPSSVYVT